MEELSMSIATNGSENLVAMWGLIFATVRWRPEVWCGYRHLLLYSLRTSNGILGQRASFYHGTMHFAH